MASGPVEKEPECWFRRLTGERMEVMLRAEGVKIRASGPEHGMYALVEWFEDHTGKRVSSPAWRRPPRTGPRAFPGQVELDDTGDAVAMPELSSHATVPAS